MNTLRRDPIPRRGALVRHFAEGGDVAMATDAPGFTTGANGTPQFTPGGLANTGALGTYLDANGGGSNIGGPTGGALGGGPPGTPGGGQLGTMSGKMATNIGLTLAGLIPGMQIPTLLAKLGIMAYGYMNPSGTGSLTDPNEVNSIGAGNSLSGAGAGNLAGTQAGALNGIDSITGDPRDADPNGGPSAGGLDMSGSNPGGAMLGSHGGYMHNGRIGALSRRKVRK